MKNKIYLFLTIFILTAFSCKGLFNELFEKSNKNKAHIEITIDKENINKINALIDTLNFRFEKYGITAQFDRSGIINNKLFINVSNYSNIEELKSLMFNQGVFEIKSVLGAGEGNDIFANSINERFVKNVAVLQSRNALFLEFELFDYYKDFFSVFSGKNLGRQIQFVLDDKVIFMPIVREVIRNGQIKIYFENVTFRQLMLYEIILLSGPLQLKLGDENTRITKTAS